MTEPFRTQIQDALGAELTPEISVTQTSNGSLSSWFAVSDLAVASIAVAATELADLAGASTVTLNRRHALIWFGMSLRPLGWQLPSVWDSIAGVYRTSDGWIRLHTNAPHHRAAALSVLECPGERADVERAVLPWAKSNLELAIVNAGGAAAAMRSREDWADHPQGRAVSQEPLIAWDTVAEGVAPAQINGLRVLDLTRVLAGPVATRLLAGFGANVLRIDPPDWNEPGVEPEVTLGKRRAGLDLKQAADRGSFEALLRRADVLVHGYRPGALAGLGYDVAQRRALAPALTEVTLDAYGWTGPWAERRRFDSLVQMSSGIAEAGMRLSNSDRPLPLPVQALDHATGYLMAAAVLRALRMRRDSGRIMSARLSLARTAALLMSAGTHKHADDMSAETNADWDPELEQTPMGPARRVRFPVQIDGQFPRWREPGGRVRVHSASWR